MKYVAIKIFSSLILLNLSCWARNILLQAPTSSDIQYREFLDSHRDLQSFSDHSEAQLQKNQHQESQLFKLGDVFNQNIPATLQIFKDVQSESPLTLLSLRYMRDLSEKALSLQKNSLQERQELLYLYCKSSLLLNEGPVLYSCPSQYVSLILLKKRYPQVVRVLIETMPITIENKETLLLSQQTAYHWTLLSNAHFPIKFYGTFQQLLNQQFQFESLINGDCEGFSHQNLDFEIINEGSVFFSSDCQKRVKPFEDKKSWVAENKNILLVAGGLLITGLIYNHAKGKKYVIDTTSLK